MKYRKKRRNQEIGRNKEGEQQRTNDSLYKIKQENKCGLRI
jgi:hypothetical protein